MQVSVCRDPADLVRAWVLEDLNSSCQTWWKASVPTEPFHWSRSQFSFTVWRRQRSYDRNTKNFLPPTANFPVIYFCSYSSRIRERHHQFPIAKCHMERPDVLVSDLGSEGKCPDVNHPQPQLSHFQRGDNPSVLYRHAQRSNDCTSNL